MLQSFRRVSKKEDGAVAIVEASIVFPVMFFVLVFLIFMGNAHYIKAQVESVTEKYAIQGASLSADPLLSTFQRDGVPSLKDLQVKPYRYLFGGMNAVEREVTDRVRKEISNSSSSFFKNMKPKIRTPRDRIAKFHNYVVYSTFSVELQCDVRFPIRFLGEDSPTVLTINARSEVPVCDVTEFIRNTDLVIDVFHSTRIGQSISSVFGKVNEFIANFAGK